MLMSNLERHLFYVCCRDGKVRHNVWTRRVTNKSRIIPKQSRKLDNQCLARMNVTIYEDNRVSVWYLPHHTGHSTSISEMKYIPLSLSVKDKIAQKIALGISMERIMDGNYTVVIVVYFN